jgi:uncharacterized membrane protein HdeD (DUF308 family)
MKPLLQKTTNALKYWWMPMIIGVLFVIAGIWTITTPVASFVALAIFFAAFMFVSGIFNLIFAISNRSEIEDWGWHLAGAIFDFVVGAILFFHPPLTMAVLPYLVAFYFMFKGFATFGFSFDMRRYGDSRWGWLLFSGSISILLSIMIIFNPTLGGLTIVIFTAMAFFSLGLFNIVLSLGLKKIKNKGQDIKEGLQELKKRMS